MHDSRTRFGQVRRSSKSKTRKWAIKHASNVISKHSRRADRSLVMWITVHRVLGQSLGVPLWHMIKSGLNDTSNRSYMVTYRTRRTRTGNCRKFLIPKTRNFMVRHVSNTISKRLGKVDHSSVKWTTVHWVLDQRSGVHLWQIFN